MVIYHIWNLIELLKLKKTTEIPLPVINFRWEEIYYHKIKYSKSSIDDWFFIFRQGFDTVSCNICIYHIKLAEPSCEELGEDRGSWSITRGIGVNECNFRGHWRSGNSGKVVFRCGQTCYWKVSINIYPSFLYLLPAMVRTDEEMFIRKVYQNFTEILIWFFPKNFPYQLKYWR